MMYIKQLLALLLVGRSAADAKTALVPKTSLLNEKALLVRGGAGPLDVKTTAKVMSGILGAQSAYNYLAPEKNNEAYGLTDCDDVTNWLSKGSGAVMGSAAIAAIAILYFDMDPIKALGAGTLLGTVHSLEVVLTEGAAKVGFSPVGQWLDLIINAFMSHTFLTGADYAQTAGKVYAAFSLLVGIQCRLAPQKGLETWGLEGEASDNALFFTKILGQLCVASGVFIGAISSGVDPSTALGYYYIPMLLSFLEFIASGESEDVGIGKEIQYPWILASAATIGTLSF